MARPDENGNIVCTGCERELPGTTEYFHEHRDAFKPKCKECRGNSFGVHHSEVEHEDGMKTCCNCQRLLPADVEHFHRTKKTSSGFVGRCKECRMDGFEFGTPERPNRVYDIPDGEWMCKGCEQVLPLDSTYFYERDNYRGFESLCKACSAQRRNQARRESLEDVENDLTPKEWRAIKESWVVDGETVCAYCGEQCEPTRDHVRPISNGGDTVYDNIVPCCGSCNGSKGDSDVMIWYPQSDVFDKIRWQKIQDHIAGDLPQSNLGRWM